MYKWMAIYNYSWYLVYGEIVEFDNAKGTRISQLSIPEERIFDSRQEAVEYIEQKVSEAFSKEAKGVELFIEGINE